MNFILVLICAYRIMNKLYTSIMVHVITDVYRNYTMTIDLL